MDETDWQTGKKGSSHKYFTVILEMKKDIDWHTHTVNPAKKSYRKRSRREWYSRVKKRKRYYMSKTKPSVLGTLQNYNTQFLTFSPVFLTFFPTLVRWLDIRKRPYVPHMAFFWPCQKANPLHIIPNTQKANPFAYYSQHTSSSSSPLFID